MVLDLKKELAKFPIYDVKALGMDEQTLPDAVKTSILLYNKAIQNLKSDSSDIAMIELKNVVSSNPNFYEAQNLLGLCYACSNDEDKAIQIFKKVVKAENNSVLALKYLSTLRVINTNDDVVIKVKKTSGVKTEKKKESSMDVWKDWLIDAININTNHKGEVKKFILGCILGSAVVCVFSLPSYFNDANKQNIVKTPITSPKNVVDISQYVPIKQFNKLTEDNKTLVAKQQQLNIGADYYNNVTKIFKVEKLAAESKIYEAADLLMILKTIEFSENEKWKMDALLNDVMNKAADLALSEGMSLYQQGKTQEAIERLKKVKTYVTEWVKMPDTLYYLGLASNDAGDKKYAYECLKAIVDKYPSFRYFRTAKSYVNQLAKDLGL